MDIDGQLLENFQPKFIFSIYLDLLTSCIDLFSNFEGVYLVNFHSYNVDSKFRLHSVKLCNRFWVSACITVHFLMVNVLRFIKKSVIFCHRKEYLIKVYQEKVNPFYHVLTKALVSFISIDMQVINSTRGSFMSELIQLVFIWLRYWI